MKKYIIGSLLIALSLITPAYVIIRLINFTQNCSGYLKQTADASSPELALDRLNLAVNYIEDNNLIDGYTSILWKTENDNIGFWYQNLKVCQNELVYCIDATQLEKSNVLMKVREALTDTNENGTSITVPTGIYKYPYNKAFAFCYTLSLILFVCGLGFILANINY